ncbi:hypothetical protein L596_016958 [Steinernema carpocapsae]|uniref:Uncharacterized protein n=1 Tax=Steinernema carpocapsae TaxID=34508 RepID=A0A4V6A1H8_STECR|nr:hypothetical protein L596_016958 [Steinernema carpocapsae]
MEKRRMCARTVAEGHLSRRANVVGDLASGVTNRRTACAPNDSLQTPAHSGPFFGSPSRPDRGIGMSENCGTTVALFVSKTDRSFPASELEMTPLCDFQTCLHLVLVFFLATL